MRPPRRARMATRLHLLLQAQRLPAHRHTIRQARSEFLGCCSSRRARRILAQLSPDPNKTSRSKVERRPRSDAWLSKKTCADLRPSSRSKEKNSHSALSLEEALAWAYRGF